MGGVLGAGAGDDGVGRLRVRLLDGFAVAVDGRAIPEAAWPSRKARQLLKLLALAPGHRVHRDQALEALWPDLTAAGATRALYQTLHLLRRALEPGAPRRAASRYVRLDRDGVALIAPGGVETDLAAFGRAAADALGTGALADLRAALAFGSEVLPDDRYEEWTLGPRRALREQRLALLAALAAAHERAGQAAAAAAALGAVLELEPAHEPAHAGLMRLYAAAGRRDEALRQYARLQRALREELGAAPDAATQRLHAALLAGPPPGAPPPAPDAAPRAHRAAAPPDLAAPPAPAPAAPPRQLTSFVGRARELAEVAGLLQSAPLVTLTGPGGVGKTRLALEVAGRAAGAWPDGVGFVDLAPVGDPGLVPQAVAAALGLREMPGRSLLDTLAGALGPRRVLLLLDNCEHLVEACAWLADALLRAGPGVRVLATSREPLGVAGEATYRVPSLAVPDADHPLPPAQLAQGEAVRLFAARAAAVRPGFAVTGRNAAPVAAVCRCLDGLPLALELAAAQVRALSVAQLATRLDDRFRLLTGGPRPAPARHRTLRAAIDWSYDRLTPVEQTLFARLSVFVGGFALEAAEAVGADDAPGLLGASASTGASGCALEARDVLELLTRLADTSLVTATPVDDAEGAVRYRLLETLRQYAAERLRAAGDAAAARDRHAAHFLARTEALGGRVERAAMRLTAEEFRWFAGEHDNLRAALAWLRDRGDAERALRLGAALGRVWFHLGHLSEGRAWLRELLALPGAAAPPAPPDLRAWALDTAASLARRQGDYAAARALHEEALALVRAAGDRPAEVWSLDRLAVVAAVAGDAATARARVGEMLAAAEALGDPAWRAEGDFVLGLVAVLCHEYPAARAHLEAALAVWRPAGHRLRSGYVLASLATAALGLGDRAAARAHLAEALGTARAFGDQTLTAWSFELLARAAAAAGQPGRAARLAGAAAALRARMSAPMSEDEAASLEGDLARVQRALGPERYRAARAAGAALTPEEAVAEALACPVPE
jgi:predicted ATPase/DNA-binding SARP family transcriptional activator